MSSVVDQTLVEKIEQQTRVIAELRLELQRAKQAAIGPMIGHLRMREAVLLYVGQDAEDFAQQLAVRLGSDDAREVSKNLFVLDNAPLTPEVRSVIRQATNRGMNRW